MGIQDGVRWVQHKIITEQVSLIHIVAAILIIITTLFRMVAICILVYGDFFVFPHLG